MYFRRTGPMRYPQDDLPILSAEIYNDSTSLSPPTRVAASRKTQVPSVSSRGPDEGSKKRARTQVAEATDVEDEKRRARGRPRLDTKDETAADVS